MRRLSTLLAPLCLVAAVLGCHHTAGVCDCGYDGYGCCFAFGHHYGHEIAPVAPVAPVPPPAEYTAPVPVQIPAIKAEPIKELPREVKPNGARPRGL